MSLDFTLCWYFYSNAEKSDNKKWGNCGLFYFQTTGNMGGTNSRKLSSQCRRWPVPLHTPFNISRSLLSSIIIYNFVVDNDIPQGRPSSEVYDYNKENYKQYKRIFLLVLSASYHIPVQVSYHIFILFLIFCCCSYSKISNKS